MAVDAPVEARTSTDFGDFSEELDTEIDGEMRHVRIYHRSVDDNWSEYTVLLEDDSVLMQNHSLTRPFLSTEEPVSP